MQSLSQIVCKQNKDRELDILIVNETLEKAGHSCGLLFAMEHDKKGGLSRENSLEVIRIEGIAVFAPQSSRTGQYPLASRAEIDAVCFSRKGRDVVDHGLMFEPLLVHSREGNDLSKAAALGMSGCSKTEAFEF